MNREEIYNKIIDVSEKYGDRNPQQLKQLHFILEKQNPDEVFNGLYRVFLKEDGERFTQQQLAGVLLYKIRPKVFIKLTEIIKGCLKTWNLSVEELPLYLREQCGKDRVLDAISEVRKSDISDDELKSLETFEWWLGRERHS